MATVGRKFADRLIRGGGRLPEEQEDAPDNPFVDRIVEYTNQGGNLAYGITFGHDDPEKYLRESSYVVNPRVFWEREL